MVAPIRVVCAMIKVLMRFVRLFFGLFLYGVGIVLTMNAHIGYAPWEVFHAGLALVFDLPIGFITMLVGLIICVVSFFVGERLGIATICNMIFVGIFMDLLLAWEIIPIINNLYLGILQLVVGLFVIALASYFYISSGYGAGPRDSLMVALARKTKLPVGACRGGMEVTVVIIGALLGGMLGIGTLLSAFLIGFCIQIVFRLFHFDPTKIEHEDLGVSLKKLLAYLKRETSIQQS